MPRHQIPPDSPPHLIENERSPMFPIIFNLFICNILNLGNRFIPFLQPLMKVSFVSPKYWAIKLPFLSVRSALQLVLCFTKIRLHLAAVCPSRLCIILRVTEIGKDLLNDCCRCLVFVDLLFEAD